MKQSVTLQQNTRPHHSRFTCNWHYHSHPW